MHFNSYQYSRRIRNPTKRVTQWSFANWAIVCRISAIFTIHVGFSNWIRLDTKHFLDRSRILFSLLVELLSSRTLLCLVLSCKRQIVQLQSTRAIRNISTVTTDETKPIKIYQLIVITWRKLKPCINCFTELFGITQQKRSLDDCLCVYQALHGC